MRGKLTSLICGGCNFFVADAQAVEGSCPECGRIFAIPSLAKDALPQYRDKPTLSRALDKLSRMS